MIQTVKCLVPARYVSKQLKKKKQDFFVKIY